MASPQLPLGSPGICEWKQNGAKGLGSLRVMGGAPWPPRAQVCSTVTPAEQKEGGNLVPQRLFSLSPRPQPHLVLTPSAKQPGPALLWVSPSESQPLSFAFQSPLPSSQLWW